MKKRQKLGWIAVWIGAGFVGWFSPELTGLTKSNSQLESLPPPAAVVDVFTAARNCTVLVDTESGQGSAVLIRRTDSRGRVRVFAWTAYHVVEGAEDITVIQGVYLGGYRVAEYSAPAFPLAFSAEEDLALLLVDYPVAPWNGYAEFVPWNSPGIGDSIFHVGNLRGHTHPDSVTAGVVSQLNARPNLVGWPWIFPLDQGNITSYPGSSGGGIFDRGGCYAGMLVGNAGPGISFYVPIHRIYAWAREHGIEWAAIGEYCPVL